MDPDKQGRMVYQGILLTMNTALYLHKLNQTKKGLILRVRIFRGRYQYILSQMNRLILAEKERGCGYPI